MINEMHMADDFYTITMLLDIYGSLLTPRQYTILDLHYNNDYSLGEISEQLNISRQGVFDNIKRGRSSLYKLESSLCLVAKFTAQKSKATEVLTLLDRIETPALDTATREVLTSIKQTVQDMINKF